MEHGKCVSWECRSSARETPIFLLFWIMENGPQIRTQLAEKRLKLDSSSLEYEVGPTGPCPAQCVSERSLTYFCSAHLIPILCSIVSTVISPSPFRLRTVSGIPSCVLLPVLRQAPSTLRQRGLSFLH